MKLLILFICFLTQKSYANEKLSYECDSFKIVNGQYSDSIIKTDLDRFNNTFQDNDILAPGILTLSIAPNIVTDKELGVPHMIYTYNNPPFPAVNFRSNLSTNYNVTHNFDTTDRSYNGGVTCKDTKREKGAIEIPYDLNVKCEVIEESNQGEKIKFTKTFKIGKNKYEGILSRLGNGYNKLKYLFSSDYIASEKQMNVRISVYNDERAYRQWEQSFVIHVDKNVGPFQGGFQVNLDNGSRFLGCSFDPAN